jgi:maleate cis-trans isomerase
MDAIPLIERRFGRPVVTSNQAALEATLSEVERSPGPSEAVLAPGVPGE